MSALLSILALYNYDNSIFDNMVLPEGIEKEDVTNNLLLELSELEILYADPNMMKFSIGVWSKKELPVWKKLYNTTQFEYNPIYNFDRTEEIEDHQTSNLQGNNTQNRNLHGTDNEIRDLSGSNNETRNLTGSNNEVRNLSGSNNETRDLTGSDTEARNLTTTGSHESATSGTTKNNGTDTQKEYVSAFNETTPTLSKQTEQTLGQGNTVTGTVETADSGTEKGTIGHSTTDSGTIKHSTTDTGTVNQSTTDAGTINQSMTDKGNVNRSTSDTGDINTTINNTGFTDSSHKARLYGNIGVTTTQQMIEAEREVVKFNVIDYIIESFKKRFCILIY